MSDENKKAREERRKNQEERRRARAKEIQERNDDQRLDVEDLIDEQGLDPLEVAIVATHAGVVACKKAPIPELNRFKKAVERGQKASSGNRRERRAAQTTDSDEDTKALVRSARLYPEDAKFEAILAEYPLVWETLGEELVNLGGAGFEADIRKN